MQVERVELIEREEVDVLLHLVDGEEVPRHIKHRASPSEARLIDDPAGGDRPTTYHTMLALLGLDRGGEQLPQRLHATEQPGTRSGDQAHGVGADR